MNQVPLHRSTYHLATLLTIPLAVSLLFFWAVTHGSPKLVLAWEILPQSYLLIFLVLLTLPLHKLSRAGRHRFLVALKRVSVGGLAEAHDGKFGDIILADVVTSYARVLGDFFVSVCMFVTPGVSSTNYPDRSCGGDVAVPLIVSIPSLIRLRQCLIEYSRVRKSGHQVEGWGGQHLANALKYASALPVYIVRALYRRQHSHNAGMGMAGLHRLWYLKFLRLPFFAFLLRILDLTEFLAHNRILFTFINSLYSFYWDVAKDWELSLFSPNERDDPDYPIGLRRHRFFHANEMYYGAITVDFLLRFAWVLRWSARTDDLESEIFALIMLEVIRRWMWIFLRIETEWGELV